MDLAHGPSPRALSRWTGTFVDPALEARFRDELWPDSARRTGLVALLCASFLLLFGIADYLSLGPVPMLAVCFGLRLLLFAAALHLFLLGRRAAPRRRMELPLLGFLFLLPTVMLVILALQRRGLSVELPGMFLLTLAYYLFVPLALPRVAAAASYAAVAFLVQGIQRYAPAPTELFVVGMELLLCNVLGLYAAVRTHRQRRVEWLSLCDLKARAGLEELLARLSTRFINLPVDRIDAAIGAALAELGAFADADRSYVFIADLARRTKSCAYEWCRDGIGPHRERLQNLPLDEMRWEALRLLRGELVHVPDVSQLPDEAASERAEFELEGIRSLLLVPMFCGGEYFGFVGFDWVRRVHDFNADQATLLRMAGEMVVNLMQRRRAESRLRAHVAELERSNVELQQFAYIASHDLQEPLRSIASFAELLARRYDGRLDAEGREFIGFITDGAQRLHGMIRDLLEYSRVDGEARPFTRCDTGAIVGNVVRSLDLTMREFGARVEYEGLPAVRGDPVQLSQLFQNLIGNALKFRDHAPPLVRIEARRAGPTWLFSIADNGIGIDPRHTGRLFRIFARLHGRDRYPGSGIGLAVCRRIVERHGGRIWVVPNVPQGSRFCFLLRPADPDAGIVVQPGEDEIVL